MTTGDGPALTRGGPIFPARRNRRLTLAVVALLASAHARAGLKKKASPPADAGDAEDCRAPAGVLGIEGTTGPFCGTGKPKTVEVTLPGESAARTMSCTGEEADFNWTGDQARTPAGRRAAYAAIRKTMEDSGYTVLEPSGDPWLEFTAYRVEAAVRVSIGSLGVSLIRCRLPVDKTSGPADAAAEFRIGVRLWDKRHDGEGAAAALLKAVALDADLAEAYVVLADIALEKNDCAAGAKYDKLAEETYKRRPRQKRVDLGLSDPEMSSRRLKVSVALTACWA